MRKTSFQFKAVCLVVATVSVQVFAGANLIRNGTFEGSATQHKWGGYWDSKGFSCPGWKFEGLSGIAKSDGVWVAEKFSVGRYAMFLQPWKDATVSQVIPILPPGDYRLSFNYVARPNHPGNTQIWLGTKKLGEVESDATMRHFSTDFSLSEKQENVLFKFFSPARDAEKDIAIENVVLQRLDASIGDAKYPDLLTAMIHAADGDTIVYAPADGDAELKDGAALAWRATGRVRSLKEEDGKLILVVGAAAQGKSASADVGLLPAEIGLGWENGWVKEWVRDVPGLTVTDVRTPAGDGFERVVRRWVWHGAKPLEKVTLSVRYRQSVQPRDQGRTRPRVLRREGRVRYLRGASAADAVLAAGKRRDRRFRGAARLAVAGQGRGASRPVVERRRGGGGGRRGHRDDVGSGRLQRTPLDGEGHSVRRRLDEIRRGVHHPPAGEADREAVLDPDRHGHEGFVRVPAGDAQVARRLPARARAGARGAAQADHGGEAQLLADALEGGPDERDVRLHHVLQAASEHGVPSAGRLLPQLLRTGLGGPVGGVQLRPGGAGGDAGRSREGAAFT